MEFGRVRRNHWDADRIREAELSKFARKVDTNQLEIKQALITSGYQVDDTSHFGCGFPDLMVKAKNNAIVLMEVKQAKGKLTKVEAAFFFRWFGSHVYIVRSIEQALEIMQGEDLR